MVTEIRGDAVANYLSRLSMLIVDDPRLLEALHAQRSAVADASTAYAPADEAVPSGRVFVDAVSTSRAEVADALADAINADGIHHPITGSDIITIFAGSERRHMPDSLTGDDVDPLDLLGQASTPVSGPTGDAVRGSQADPVDTLTGALWRADDDLTIRSEGPTLRLTRTWTSRITGAGLFGHGWRSLLDVRAQVDGDMVWLEGPDGSSIPFHRRSSAFEGPSWTTVAMTVVAGRPVAHLADGTTWRFDADGWLRHIHDEEGRGWTLSRDDDQIVIESTCGRRVVCNLGAGRVVSIDGPAGAVVLAHDGDLLVEVAHPDRTVRYDHDDAGRITQVTTGDRLLVRSRFDSAGRVVSQEDAAGGRWTFRHEPGGAIVTHPDGCVVRDAHRRDGRLASQSRDGVTVSRPYRVVADDLAANRLDADLADARIGVARISRRDAHGRPSELHEQDRSTTITWDEADRLATAVSEDAAGIRRELVAREVAGGGTRRAMRQGGVEGVVERDRFGDITAWSTDAGAWALERDPFRRPTALVAPDGGTTSWEWTHDGLLASRTSPLGRTVLTRDAHRMLTAIDAPGQRIELTWGRRGQLSSLDLGAGPVRFSEDDHGLITAVRGDGVDADLAHVDGCLAAVTDASGTHTYAEDGTRRIRRHTEAPDTVVDLSGRRPLHWVDDLIVGQVTPAGGEWRDGVGPGGDLQVDLDLPGRSCTTRLPGGVQIVSTYDESGLLREQHARDADGDVLFEETVTTDAAGRVTTWDHAGDRWDVRRDHLGRVSGVDVDGAALWSARHDSAGRLRERRGPHGGWVTDLDAQGRVVALRHDDGDVRRLRRDGAGRVVEDGDWRFGYNALGRMTRAEDREREIVIEHDIDVHGRRVATRTLVGGALVRDLRWAWDTTVLVPRPLLVEDRVSGRRELVRYDASGYPIAIVDPDDPSRDRWFIADHLGTPRVELDGAGTVRTRHRTDPFGVGGPVDGPGEGPLLRVGFAGSFVDGVTGHLHLLDRQMDPTLGRFLTPDPLQAGVGAHHQDPYGYCDGRPLDLRDPDGRLGISLPNPFTAVADVASSVTGAMASGATSLVEGMADGMRSVGDAIHDGAMAVDDFYDRNRTVINGVVAAAGVVALTVGTAGLAGPVAAGVYWTATAVAAGGTALSAADNYGDGNVAAAAFDVAMLPLIVFGGSALSGVGGRAASAAGFAADDAARLAGPFGNAIAGHLGLVGLPVSAALGSGCPPA